jgi:hypothetical protein
MFAYITINKEVEVKGVYIPPQTFYPRIVNVLTVHKEKARDIYFYPSVRVIQYSHSDNILSPERLILLGESSTLYLDLIDENRKERLYLKSDDFDFKGFLTEYQLIELITKDLNY